MENREKKESIFIDTAPGFVWPKVYKLPILPVLTFRKQIEAIKLELRQQKFNTITMDTI